MKRVVCRLCDELVDKDIAIEYQDMDICDMCVKRMNSLQEARNEKIINKMMLQKGIEHDRGVDMLIDGGL